MATRLYFQIRPSATHGPVLASWGLGWGLWLFTAVFVAGFLWLIWVVDAGSTLSEQLGTYGLLGGVVVAALWTSTWPRVWLTTDHLLVRDVWFLLEIALVDVEAVYPDPLTTFLEVDLVDGRTRSLFAIQSGALPQLLRWPTRARRIARVIGDAAADARRREGTIAP